MTMTVLTVIGTRPEAIKLAPVVHALHQCAIEPHAQVRSLVCVTAQHRDMLDQALKLFSITPDFDLNSMEHGQSVTQTAAKILAGIERVLHVTQPDWVLVQGDTVTASASALAAFYNRIRVGHVEAGLRTYNSQFPFPEEVNRRMVSLVAERHFAPTKQACENLLAEQIPRTHITITGNTAVDTLQMITRRPMSLIAASEKLQARAEWPAALKRLLSQADGRNDGSRNGREERRQVSLANKRRIILVTAHRRENIGEPLASICSALKEIACLFGNRIHIVFSVHPNPDVSSAVRAALSDVPNILLVPPLDYGALIHLMKASYLILTDSGGIQEEGPSLGVPVLVLRTVTERGEGVRAGAVKLVGTECVQIVEETRRLLEDQRAYAQMAQVRHLYGDGNAAVRIVAALLGETTGEWAEPA